MIKIKREHRLLIGALSIVSILIISHVLTYKSALWIQRRDARDEREGLDSESFSDFFEEFDVFTRISGNPFTEECWNFWGANHNFTTIGTVTHSQVITENKDMYGMSIFVNPIEYYFLNISLTLKRSYYDEIMTHELNIMILADGDIFFYENQINEDIFIDFQFYYPNNIEIIIF